MNSLCPGLIETGMTEYQFKGARQRGTEAKIGQLNPLGRYGVAEGGRVVNFSSSYINPVSSEIAQAALFLASGKQPI